MSIGWDPLQPPIITKENESIEKMQLKKIVHIGKGYMPLVMTKDWQLAQLNYTEVQKLDKVHLLDQHTFTDETFTLITGRSLLITYDEKNGEYALQPLEPGCTFNIPQMMWHNIVMEKGSSVLITESRDAHLKGLNQIEMPSILKMAIADYVRENW